MRFFDIDSPLTHLLNRLADLMILNLLTLALCIPVVTAGAAITAMHYVLIRMVKNEEGYLVKSFFKSFRLNFKQSTALWLIALVMGGVLLVCCASSAGALLSGSSQSVYLIIVAMALMAFILLAAVAAFIFPLQARYDNSIVRTLSNAFALSLRKLGVTFCMVIITFFPVGLLLTVGKFFPFFVLFGLSVPAYACAQLYVPIFDRLEKHVSDPS